VWRDRLKSSSGAATEKGREQGARIKSQAREDQGCVCLAR
jgi:hypothetical protein